MRHATVVTRADSTKKVLKGSLFGALVLVVAVVCALSFVKPASAAPGYPVTIDDTMSYPMQIDATRHAAMPLSDTPVLTAIGRGERISATAAKVMFERNKPCVYYYAVVEPESVAPTIDTSGGGAHTNFDDGLLTVGNLNDTNAKVVYIVGKDESGNLSNMIVIEIPAFIPTYFALIKGTVRVDDLEFWNAFLASSKRGLAVYGTSEPGSDGGGFIVVFTDFAGNTRFGGDGSPGVGQDGIFDYDLTTRTFTFETTLLVPYYYNPVYLYAGAWYLPDGLPPDSWDIVSYDDRQYASFLITEDGQIVTYNAVLGGTPPPDTTAPLATIGSGAHTVGDDASLVFTTERSMNGDKFTGLLVDGDGSAFDDLVRINETTFEGRNAIVTEGSTVVTLKPAYLNTLSVGSHTITLLYADGVDVTGAFTITEVAAASPTPNTGDNSTAVLGLGALSALTGIGLLLRRRVTAR